MDVKNSLPSQFEGNSNAPSRRAILKGVGAVGAGLTLGVHLVGPAKVVAANAVGQTDTFAPNAFVRIRPDNTVTVLIKHIEVGQGTFTGLSTLVAEELDADWAQMRAEAAPADVRKYKNLLIGLQGTGGSTAMANAYLQMREAGAAARAMIVAAAARKWGVDAAKVVIKNGVVKDTTTDRTATFGDLAGLAAEERVPFGVDLKKPEDFTLIGRDVRKLDTHAKTYGKTDFTIDFKKDGMLTVVVARSPLFGATVKSFDAREALKVKGVEDVRQIPGGVAVYAKSYWQAIKGREALRVDWDDSGAEKRSSQDIEKAFRDLAKSTGKIAVEVGEVEPGLSTATRVLEAEYIFPFLAHGPMEPLDCAIEYDETSARAWGGSQLQTIDQTTVAQVLGFKPEQVSITTLYTGGSFGRRATPTGEVMREAAHCAKALGKINQPLRLLRSREDDMTLGYYRPVVVHRLKGGVDGDGNIVAWDQTIAAQSIVAGTPFGLTASGQIDKQTTEGADEIPYAMSSRRLSVHTAQTGVPVLWWRSVGHSHTAFAIEAFLDELLEAAGKDAVEGRLALLKEGSRDVGVLKRVAEMADWGRSVASGRALGVAVHKSFSTYVAQIVEVSKNDVEDIPRVHKVWCAVDCGVAVNPNIVKAQMEGGIGYGLSAALFNAITLKKGRVEQSNFDAYRSLRINEMPDVEVSIMPSAEPPTGVGEPGTPPIAPAVANAWAKLTGVRVRRLPFWRGGA